MEDMRKVVNELVFGDGVSRPMDISATRLNNNVVVVGSTGAGKTTAYTEANLLSFSECSVVVSMSKRVLADRYAEEYERRGYEVAVVDLAEPSASPWGYDPLAMVRNAEDVSDLAREVVQANAEHEQDPYWSNSAAVLLEALLLASLEMRRVDASLPPASISDAIDLFEELSFRDGRGGVSESTLDHLFEALEMKDPCSEAAAKWRSVKGLAYKTVSCVYSTLSVALSKMFTRSVKDVCASERLFDPSSLGVKKTALFIITSPVNLAAHSFCQLMYGGIFKSLFELAEASPGYAVPVPVHVICDDFAVGAKIASFPGTISVMRSAGVSVSLLIQSRRQLAAMYGEVGASIIWDNCDTAVYIGSTNSDDTAREVASRLDVPISRVLTMPADEVVVIQRGRRPVVCRVFPTLTDERRVRILQGEAPYKNNFAHRQENLSAEGRL